MAETLKIINELNSKVKAKKEEMIALASTEGKADEARKAKAELDDMEARLNMLVDEHTKSEQVKIDNLAATKPIETQAKKKSEYPIGAAVRKMLADKFPEYAREVALRRGGEFKAMLEEGTPAKGGYTVPEDISTAVQRYREAAFSLRDLISVETVYTESGARTFLKRNTKTGFQTVAEAAATQALGEEPEFERLTYTIVKRSGYMQVTKELLEDTDADIQAIVLEWLADEDRVTWNKLVTAAIKGAAATTNITTFDDIRDIINVTLGSTFKHTSTIVTNDSGMAYLDKLKDGNGKQLLQPSYSDPTKQYINFIGTLVPIKSIPNKDLPNNVDKIPFIIGDLKEGISGFERRSFTIDITTEATVNGVSAFENELVFFKGSERNDVEVRDKEAFVYCELDPNA